MLRWLRNRLDHIYPIKFRTSPAPSVLCAEYMGRFFTPQVMRKTVKFILHGFAHHQILEYQKQTHVWRKNSFVTCIFGK